MPKAQKTKLTVKKTYKVAVEVVMMVEIEIEAKEASDIQNREEAIDKGVDSYLESKVVYDLLKLGIQRKVIDHWNVNSRLVSIEHSS